jgi:hypothetical protein
MRHSASRRLTVAAAALLAGGCTSVHADFRALHSDAEPLHAAVGHLTDVIVYDIFSPPQASRAYAYASVAAYEAMRPGYPGYATLAGQLNGLAPVPMPAADSEYYFALAGVHAFMSVGRALTFSQDRMDSLRQALDERMGTAGVPSAVYERSLAYGDTVAKHILAWSRQDRFLQTRGYPKYTVTSEAGRWVPTPSAYMDAVEPNWGKLRPFVLDSASQMRAAPPHPFDTARGSPYFREMLEVYDAGRTLSDDQRELVAFWDDNPYVIHVQGHAMFATKKMSPGGHWMSIAGTAARISGANLMQTAEAYARTAIALADGFISCWDEKYRSNVIRPETVINRYVDERWQPMLQTPPFPEYTSGHSVISTAAATVLSAQFGSRFTFTDTSEARYGMNPRTFASFEEAAAEARISRLYGGIHFRRSVDEGGVQGRQIGELIVRKLRTREPAAGRVADRVAAAGR